jgi:adenylate cyclase
MPRLIQISPSSDISKAYELPPGSVTVGRATDNQIFILDKSLSRHHVRFTRDENKVLLEDLTSKNGTYVNGERISSLDLQGGETIKCGDVKFRYEVTTEVQPASIPHTSFASPTLVCDVRRDVTNITMDELLGFRKSRINRPLEQAVSPNAEEKLRVLLKVSQLLSSPEHVDKLLPKILELVVQILDVDRATILMLDEATDTLVPTVIRTKKGNENGQDFYSQHIVNYVRQHEVAVLFSDALSDPRLDYAKSIVNQSIRASMCAPIKPRDRLLGVLYVDNVIAPNRFRDEDLEFLSAFANQAAIAIENAVLYEQLEREAIMRSNLVRYFPSTAITRLMEGKQTTLNTIETEVTALFCDISGFTALCAQMEPREVVDLLNQYFPVMAQIVFKHEGTLEKYIGDALMAVWGAPFRHEEDASRALMAAVAMQQAISKQNKHWPAARQIHIHIGLNTGNVAAGNIGSKDYLQYATIGDATNMASRICSTAQVGEILISESTRQRLGRVPWLIEALGPTVLRGRNEPLQLHRVRWNQTLQLNGGPMLSSKQKAFCDGWQAIRTWK